MANNWGPWDDAHRGMHSAMTGGADVLRRQVTRQAYDNTVANGGVTINLKGNQPAKGFAFSPYKGVETIIPKEEFNEGHINDFIDKHYDILRQPGNHLGMWEDDGKIYLDISKVGPPNANTLQKAMDAKQLAAFDLGKFAEIPLGNISEGGEYKPLYEATNHPYLIGGQNKGST